ELPRPGGAAHFQRGQFQGLASPADDEFGGTAADVDHQPPVVRGGQVLDHAQVDQPGFFLAGNDFDRETQGLFRRGQDLGRVASHPEGIGGHGADVGGRKPAQPFAKAPQGRQGLLYGGGVDAHVVVQAVGQGDQFAQFVFGINLGAGTVTHDASDG